MKTPLFLFCTALVSLVVLPAQASSGGTRGGGRALVCRDAASGKITSARMLDLLEGVEPSPIGYSLTILESLDSIFFQAQKDTIVTHLIAAQMEKLNGLEALQTALVEKIEKIRNEKVMEAMDDDLFLPEDLGKIHLVKKPKNCKLEGVGVYLEDDRLHVNPEIYASMDTTNQAAFFVHEGVYAFLREVKFRIQAQEEQTRRLAGIRRVLSVESSVVGPRFPPEDRHRIHGTSEVARKITAEFSSTLKKVSFDFTRYQRVLAPEKEPSASSTFAVNLSPSRHREAKRSVWWLKLNPRSFIITLDVVDAYHEGKPDMTHAESSFVDFYALDGRTGWIECDRKAHVCLTREIVVHPHSSVPILHRIEWDPSSSAAPVISAKGQNFQTLRPVRTGT